MIKFTLNRNIEYTLEQAQEDVEEWFNYRDIFNKGKAAKIVGEYLNEMMRDRKATIAFLRSPNTNLRLIAISLVAEYWPDSEEFASDVLRIAFDDPESVIRGGALVSVILKMGSFIEDKTGFLDNLRHHILQPLSEEENLEFECVIEEASRLADASLQRTLKELAGSSLSEMLKSRAAAESYLFNTEPQLRSAALVVLKDHWGKNAKLIQACERMTMNDPSDVVRSYAISCLAGCYMGTDDSRVGDLVARVVVNESQPQNLRFAAYCGLLSIRGMPTESFLHVSPETFCFPDDVDWAFVDSFLQSK